MKPKLALSLTGTRLHVELVRPPAKGFYGVLRSLPLVGGAQSGPAQEAIGVVELRTPMDRENVRSGLEQAMAALKARHDTSRGKLDLEVQLGLDHARIGLMVLEDASATALASSTCEAYAQAWVRQMLHLDPQRQLIRWQILADAHKLLISCVDREIFDALNDFAREHRLRFASCRPAVLSAIAAKLNSAEPATAGPLTVVWTEEGGIGASRTGSVQLLGFDGKHLVSAWRGWIPAPAPAQEPDPALEGTIRRFQASNLAGAEGTVTRLHWPAIAPNAARIH